MEIFTLFIVLAALFGHSFANNEAIGYETVQYYYAYKIEYQSKMPPEDRRLGLKCIAEPPGTMCKFGEFAASIYDGTFKDKIERHFSSRFTTTPDDSDATFLSNNADEQQRLDAKKLTKTFVPSVRPPLYAELVEDMTSVIVKAAEAGGIYEVDFQRATEFAEKARKVRLDASFPHKVKAVKNAMNNVLKNSGDAYLKADDVRFDFPATFEAINEAVAKSQMTDKKGNGLKKIMEEASHGNYQGNSRDRKHWGAIASYSDFISKGTLIAGRVAAGASIPAAGGAACGSAFSSDPVII